MTNIGGRRSDNMQGYEPIILAANLITIGVIVGELGRWLRERWQARKPRCTRHVTVVRKP
jgi:hypothetical protein